MPITLSIIVDDSRQSNGRRQIHERHIDQFAMAHKVTYMCNSGFDVPAAMAARSLQISARMKTDEYRTFIDGVIPTNYILTESTPSELLAYMREAYRESSNGESAIISQVLRGWIDSGRYTDTEVRTAFGLSVGAWTVIRNKMNTFADSRALVASARGE